MYIIIHVYYNTCTYSCWLETDIPISQTNIHLRNRGRVPWKLIFQALKLISLTVLVLFFGQQKFQLRLVLNAYQSNLGYLLIKDYQSLEKASSAGPVIHRHYEIADSAAHSLINYFNITRSAVGIFGFNVDEKNNTVLPKLCISQFDGADVDVSQWMFTFNEETVVNCTEIDCRNNTKLACRAKVYELFPESFDGFMGMQITFQIRSIFLSVKSRPKCVLLYAVYSLENELMSGAITNKFALTYDEVPCNENSNYNPKSDFNGIRETLGQIIIDSFTLICTVITGFLVIKRIRTTFKLYKQTRNFYTFHYNRTLTWGEMRAFMNGWDIFSIFADVLTIVGMVYKFLLDTGADKHLDVTAVLIGSSVAINWILALRFLSFDKGYYILVLTLSVAIPNILRLLICILAIYLGYVLCGWVVFGPYCYKFASIGQTVDTLFAVVNGDEILDSFLKVEGNGPFLSFFSKIYFYSFISLFIYVVLSVMISLIGDAMLVAQSAATTGHWLIGVDVFQELDMGWSTTCEHAQTPQPEPSPPSRQNLQNNPNSL